MTINDIEKKVSNGGTSSAGQLSAEEFNTVVNTIKEHDAYKYGDIRLSNDGTKLWCFASSDDGDAYQNNPSGNTALLLRSITLPTGGSSGGGSTMYKLELKPIGDIVKTFSTTDTTAYVAFTFTAQQKPAGGSSWEDMTGESISYTISVSTGGGSFDQVHQGYLLAGYTAQFNVRNRLIAGSSTIIRVTAKGDLTGETTTLTFQYSLTTMSLKPSNFTWYNPFIEGNTYALGGLSITGNLDKTLHIIVSSSALSYTKSYSVALGSQTWVTNAYHYEGLVFPTKGTGVYQVEIYLEANGLESEHLIYNIMCVSKADQYSAQLVTMTNIASEAVNYADNKLFSYAIYNKGGSSGNPIVKLTKTEGGSTSSFYTDTLENVATSKAHDFTTSLQISSSSSDVSIKATITYGNSQSASYVLDNSASFPATSGAVLFINPASRSNSQSNYTRILNEVDGSSISASWTNMSWTDGADGWTTDDAERKCLRLPATTSCVASIAPMSSFGTAKTLEFTFKACNASDYTEPVIKISESDSSTGSFRGIQILPDKIIVHSRDEQDDLVQSYPFKDEETIHFIITIIKNYKTTYGNLCKIYANGVGVCSFPFKNTDNWTNNGAIVFGSNTADLFVYGFRQYDLGFGAGDAFRNFISSLPDITSKRAENADYYKVLNDGEEVDYDVIKNTENTMVIEMLNGAALPQYGFDKKYSAKCNLAITIQNEISGIDPAGRKLTGKYQNQTIEGQGTTSMNYYRWNLRWKMDDDYDIRITAKKNYASSMQSHKMGATALYNDVYKKLGLSNGSTGRVAVYQYPVYGFLKTLKEGTTNQYIYQFIGLFTVGPDKGDKKTFGFKDSGLKDSLITLEGTDHSPMGVGFDYPWSQLKYIGSNEAFGASLGDGTYEKAYEVSNCGTAETDAEIQAYLNQEFAPAYNVVFENSTMIIGTTTSLATINSDVISWGLNKDADGHLYSRYMVWIDGDYTLYYLNKATNKYTSTGINLQTQLGTPSGSTVEAKNEWFKAQRRARFKANMENYWDLEDLMFHDVFLLIIAATDNLKKNFYPQKFAKLADGGRWGFRQDDLDSIFRTDNQAHQTKSYSVEQFDWTDDNKTAYVFKGEDSALHRLLFECYPNEVLQMGYRILDAMASLSDTGSTAIAKLMGCFDKYFFNKAQDYFTKSAYNQDAAYSYEDAWPPYNSGTYSVDVHPLEQSLGGNEESERGWLWLRMIYCMSLFRYGTFNTYTDTSLGRITYRPQYAQSFTLTPAIDLYPTILPGQGTGVRSANRVKAGKSVQLAAVGGNNTNVYIPAADYIRDIGDLKTLAVDSANGSMAVAGKRLQRLKLGDSDASSVTSNLTGLTITSCPSLTLIDARNLSSLVGTIDLSECPRLESAYFGGSSVNGVIIPAGAKISTLQLGNKTTAITLINLPKLSTGFSYNSLNNVEYLRVENTGFSEFTLLRNLYGTDGNVLRDIRVRGVNAVGTATDIDMLANLYNNLDKDGNKHNYYGIDSEGNASENLRPVVAGRLTISGGVYEDTFNTVKSYYTDLILNYTGGLYIRFEDPEVMAVLFANGVGDGTGIMVEDAEAVTSIGAWFNQNTEIEYFNEFEKFTGVTTLGVNNVYTAPFYKCTSLKQIKLPNSITRINTSSFSGCTSLELLPDMSEVTHLGGGAFGGCTSMDGVVNIPNVTNDLSGGEFAQTKISKVQLLGQIKRLSYGSNNTTTGTFTQCTNLESVILPETLTSIGQHCFYNCTKLSDIILPKTLQDIKLSAFYGCTSLEIDDLSLPNLTSLGQNAFYGVKIKKISNLGEITALPTAVGSSQNFGDKSVLEEVVLPETLTSIPQNSLTNYTALTKCHIPSSMVSIGAYGFSGCTSLSGDILIPNVVELGSFCFNSTNITSITAPMVQSVGGSATQGRVFYNCKALKTVIMPLVGTLCGDCFFGCTSLESVEFGNLENIMQYAFYNCDSLKEFDLGGKIATIGTAAFALSEHLELVVLRTPTPPTIAANSFQGTPIASGTGYIYVPDDSVSAYQSATNWAQYSNVIKPLSEYNG